MKPDARGTFLRPSPPGITAARPPAPCALPSNTLRKHSTCLANPNATAIAPSTTAPSWPGRSRPPLHHPSSSRSASKTSIAPAPVNPGGWPVVPGYVEMPSMSAVVRPAPSIAARHASSVSSSGSRLSRRPMSDWPTPLMTTWCSGFMASLARSVCPLRDSLLRDRSLSWLEHRDPHVLVLVGLERHLHRHADVHVI